VRWLTRIGALIGLAIGAFHLAAWMLGLPPAWAAAGAVTMKTNMALAQALAGAALLLLRGGEGDPAGARRGLAVAASAIVLLVGASTLAEYLLGVDLGIDQLLAEEPPDVLQTVSPNRMGPLGATCLTLLGAGLLALASRARGFALLGAATCCLVMVPAVGFLYGVAALYQAGQLTVIAWPTAIALLALGLALGFADPRDGSVPVLWRADSGGVLLRRALAPVVLLPVVVGFIRLAGERYGLYGRYVGTGLFAVTLSVLSLLFLWRTAAWLSRSAVRRARAEEELRRSQEQTHARAAELEATLRCVAEGVVVYDRDGRIVHSNAAADAILGYDERERALPLVDRLSRGPNEWLSEDGHLLDVEGSPAYRAARHGETIRGSVWRIRSSAGERWVTLSAAPLVVDGERIGAVLSLADITARKRAEEQLRDADRRKNDFLSVLSHELRNPLAPIRNSIHILHRAPGDGERAARARAVIERQAAQLTRLVEDLLDVTRISRGKIQLHRSRFDLAALVREVVDDQRALFAAREIDLAHAGGDEKLWVDADPARIRQLVGNLLHNASKFTNARGHVVVTTARERGCQAVVRVADDGIGIAADMLGRVFEPFAQADQGLQRTSGGLGIGLALVRSLAEMHDGAVEARSGGPGKGSEFVVSLPLVAEAARIPQPAQPEAPGPERAARLRVLVVEDNLDAAETLKDALELGGHEVVVAHDGRQGVDRARALRPDIVLCDVGLPGVDGYEVARQLASDPHRPPLVAMTGYASPDDQRRAFKAGFDYHLAKPFRFEELDQILASAVARRRPRRILVIDDNDALRANVREILEDEGWDVREARTVEQAVSQLGDFEPAVILLDYRLPDANGGEFLRRLGPISAAPPVVLMTASTHVRTVAMEHGLRFYVPKPFRGEDLIDTVEHARAGA
ncbi:MAG TPA: response regulator, partial [Anaeromyxobacteraceae bacterium]|nr:response regulator [Anaeromyxobacteraceae bacterium]